ncbi:MAG: transposase [Methanoregula sp.]
MNEFLNRPIEQPILYLIVDAVYVKVRRHSRYVNTAVLIIAGIREDGYREILGFCVADSENEGFWLSLFEDLKSRGLRGVQLVISDGHEGIQKAVKTSFLGASWQMCQVHVRQEAVVWIAEQPDFPSVWDVPTVACGSGNGTV